LTAGWGAGIERRECGPAPTRSKPRISLRSIRATIAKPGISEREAAFENRTQLMHDPIETLRQRYQSLSDDQLGFIAAEGGLTQEAKAMLDRELARRGSRELRGYHGKRRPEAMAPNTKL